MPASSRTLAAPATNANQPDVQAVGTGRKHAGASPESFEEALIDVVRALGGSKCVANALWPAMPVEDARRKLANSLSHDRAEKLSLDELQMILRMAREAGCHIGIAWLLERLSYAAPVPVEPQDQADDLRRQFIESTRDLAKLAERIEAMDRRNPRRP